MKKTVLALIVFVVATLIFQCPVFASKTFLCTGGVFDKDINDYGGECVIYVRYEIGGGDTQKYYNVCNGEAWTCYQDAIDAGYAVGQVPKIGAIVVFGRSGIYSEVGHVGLVKIVNDSVFVIHESNVSGVHTIGERTISVNDPNILDYIYCDGNGDDSTPIQLTIRQVGEYGWYPPSKSCINASNWYKIQDGRAVQEFTDNGICWSIDPIAYGVWYEVVFGENDLPEACIQQ